MTGATPFVDFYSWTGSRVVLAGGATAATSMMIATALAVPLSTTDSTPLPVQCVREILEQGTSRVGDTLDVIRRAEYMNVLGALQILASLPDDEDFYVGPVAKAEGEHALSLLYMFDLDAPKVSSHDSESVVFSWERGEAKYYLSVGDGGASFIRSTPDERGIVGHAQLDEAAIVGVLRLAGDHVGGSERVTG